MTWLEKVFFSGVTGGLTGIALIFAVGAFWIHMGFPDWDFGQVASVTLEGMVWGFATLGLLLATMLVIAVVAWLLLRRPLSKLFR